MIRARSYLERGWCRHNQAQDINGAAGMPHDINHPAVHRLTGGRDAYVLACFNNAQETVKPILAAFDRAIAADTSGSDRSDPPGHAIAMD